MALVCEIYAITKKFPRDERYGLTQQVRRSAESIIANIGEGFGRYTFADKANKYTIARGECSETETHLLVAVALKFLTEEEASKALQLVREVGRTCSGLISACHERSSYS